MVIGDFSAPMFSLGARHKSLRIESTRILSSSSIILQAALLFVGGETGCVEKDF